ncbi:hypothetical protein SteCoe_16946 [Stentor coeruleus]|uniref:N-acetyltransferase domain-containing protein n=1 Tax=Stentor coeruleus TaxID=5963 RepID=A0A1R2C020_9CILI|nr:hypothetical protein SteCoe_16946 [Stentor coeruleus]
MSEIELSDFFYIELLTNVQALGEQIKNNFFKSFAVIYEEILFFSEDLTYSELFGPDSNRVYAVLIKDKENNSVLAAAHVRIFLIENLENDISSNNTFVVPNYVIVVHKKFRKLGLAATMVETLEEAFLKDYPHRNVINFNLFFNPFSYKIFAKRTKFGYPGVPMIQNNHYDNFIMKLYSIIKLPCPKMANENFFIYELSHDIDNYFDLLRDGYKNLCDDLKLFSDLTGLKDRAGIIAIHPVKMLEGNTLGLEAGDYVVDRIANKIRVIVIN